MTIGKMQAMADDDDGTCKEGAGLPGLPALPDAGLPGAEEPADELNPLACAFRFYIIQESADEDGHTFGKVRPPSLRQKARDCRCLRHARTVFIAAAACADTRPLPARR